MTSRQDQDQRPKAVNTSSFAMSVYLVTIPVTLLLDCGPTGYLVRGVRGKLNAIAVIT